MAVKFQVFVTHYGPEAVPDPDHSTYIEIRRYGQTHGQLAVESHDELKQLVGALVEAVAKGDGIMIDESINQIIYPNDLRSILNRPNSADASINQA